MLAAVDTVNGTLSLRNGKQLNTTPGGGTLSVAAAGTLEFGLCAPDTKVPAATTNALLEVTGNASLADNMTVAVVDSGGAAPGEYVIVSASGTLTANEGTFSVSFPDALPEGVSGGTLSQEGDNLILTLLAPPSGTIVLFR
jgi:hypothetical protein